MKVESVYKPLHAFHCLIVSDLKQTEHERMSSQISKSNPKAGRPQYSWLLFYIRTFDTIFMKYNNMMFVVL